MENLEKSVILSMAGNIFILLQADQLGQHLIKHLLKINELSLTFKNSISISTENSIDCLQWLKGIGSILTLHTIESIVIIHLSIMKLRHIIQMTSNKTLIVLAVNNY